MAERRVTVEDVRVFVEDGAAEGYEVGVRDLAYALLKRSFEEPVLAFRAVFGDSPAVPFQTYRFSDKSQFVDTYIYNNFPEDEEKTETEEKTEADEERKSQGLSFEELKSGLEEDLDSLINLRDMTDADGNPALEPKEMATVVARIADIRTKLVEKFGATEKKIEQRVVVNQKYDAICPWCGHEVAAPPYRKR